jgi:hypothetical protein
MSQSGVLEHMCVIPIQGHKPSAKTLQTRSGLLENQWRLLGRIGLTSAQGDLLVAMSPNSILEHV